MFRIIFRIGTIQVLAILINLVRSKVTAVLLGPEGVGAVSVIDQVVQLAALFCAVSLPLAAVKILARAHSEGEAEFQRSYASLLRLLITLSICGTMVVVLLAWIRAPWLGADILRFRPYLLIAALNIPTMVLGGFFVNVLAAAGRVTESAFIAVVTNTVMTIASYIGISLGRILGLYAATLVAGLFLTTGIIVFLGKRLHLRLIGRGAAITEELQRNRSGLLYSLMLYLTGLTYSGSLLAARYGVLHNWGDAEAGLLQSAMAIALALGLVLNPMNGLYFMPLMNRATPPNEKLQTAVNFQKRLLVIMSMAAMALSLFPDLLVRVLFSARFAPAAQSIPLLVWSQCLLQIAAVYQGLLIGFDDVLMFGLLTCGGQLSFAALALLLSPKYGIAGTAAAFAISSLIILALAFWRARARFGFQLPPGTAAFVAYTLGAIYCAGVVFRNHTGLHPSVISAKLGVYATFAFSFFLFLSRDEREALYGMFQRVRALK